MIRLAARACFAWARFSRLSFALACFSFVCFAFVGPAGAQPTPVPAGSSPAAALLLPAGTQLELALTQPLRATARPGAPIYATTNFPVVLDHRVAIPAGTWIQGTLLAVTPPTRRHSRAELQILFTKIVFASGYVALLPGLPFAGPPSPAPSAVRVTVQVGRSNDLLLDNGAQVEMTLAAPLSLDAAQVAQSIPLTRAPAPGSFRSATLCRPTPGDPGSPGTPDTVIPGSPGTPDTTIPGGPGMPDTVIPGTPATPDTIIPGIPGTPGSPGTVCPDAPIVLSSVPLIPQPVPAQGSAAVTSH